MLCSIMINEENFFHTHHVFTLYRYYDKVNSNVVYHVRKAILCNALRGPSRQNGSKCRIFLLEKNFLQGLVDHMSKDYEPASTGTSSKQGVCMYYRHSQVHFVKPLRAVFSPFSFPKIGLLKRIELKNFRSAYRNRLYQFHPNQVSFYVTNMTRI